MAMAEKEAIIRTQELTKIFGDGSEVVALDKVTLEVASGEFLVVSGPSGSGKSTLLNLIGALDEPTQGNLVVNGVDTKELKGTELADFRRNHIGFVFQFYNLVPVLTALENIMVPLLPYRRQLDFDLEERAHSLLTTVELQARVDHLPAQLSGGEQQRVAIARALVNTPELILADEPTGNIDSRTGSRIVNLLRDLNREHGVTVILVTHNEVIAQKATRVLKLHDGKLVPVGGASTRAR